MLLRNGIPWQEKEAQPRNAKSDDHRTKITAQAARFTRDVGRDKVQEDYSLILTSLYLFAHSADSDIVY